MRRALCLLFVCILVDGAISPVAHVKPGVEQDLEEILSLVREEQSPRGAESDVLQKAQRIDEETDREIDLYLAYEHMGKKERLDRALREIVAFAKSSQRNAKSHSRATQDGHAECVDFCNGDPDTLYEGNEKFGIPPCSPTGMIDLCPGVCKMYCSAYQVPDQ